MTCGHLEVVELCVFVPQSCSGHSPEGLAAALSVCCYCGGSVALPNVTGIPCLSCLPALRRHQPGQNKTGKLSQNATSDPRLKGFMLQVLLVLAHKISPKDLVTDRTLIYLLSATIVKEES